MVHLTAGEDALEVVREVVDVAGGRLVQRQRLFLSLHELVGSSPESWKVISGKEDKLLKSN